MITLLIGIVVLYSLMLFLALLPYKKEIFAFFFHLGAFLGASYVVGTVIVGIINYFWKVR